MKVINTANGKVLANIVTNHSMTIEEALELVGIDLSQCDENEGFYLDQDGEQFWIEDLVSGEDIEIPFEIKSVEWDEDLGGLIVEVEFYGKTHQFMSQYLVDEDGDIAGTDGSCWSWVDGDNVEGEINGITIVDKLPFKDIENPARGEEKAWDFFEEVMNEAKKMYNENKNAEERMLELLVEENECCEEDTQGEAKAETLKHYYRTDLLTENVARNGRRVLWYISTNDSAKSIAIYIDTLEELTEEEIEEQLV